MVKYDLMDLFDVLSSAKLYDKDLGTIKFKDFQSTPGIHYEYGDNNELIIDVPGCTKEDISIYVEDFNVVIEIEKKKSKQKFLLSKGFKVKDAECKNGQLIIYFEEIKKDVLKIDVK